jgi:SAM-dependent methyltransferase
MIGMALVRPLEEGWRETLDAVARSRGWPGLGDVARVAARVADLSAAYNDPRRAAAAVREAGIARLLFSFPRDVPKGAGAVRELLATRAVPLEGTLRVLDVGAGLGAMTWGLARAREAAGGRGDLEATWVDTDDDALELGRRIVAARGLSSGIRARCLPIGVDAVARSLPDEGPFDVILLGQVLSELDVGADETARVDRHVALVRELMDRRLAQGGSLVVVEPALRDRTRHLHRVRNAAASLGAGVFAPCLHGGPCPALAEERGWCHEDLPVDLPLWLRPVARAAGLRYEGLTFSYLVLRNDSVSLAGALAPAPGGTHLRVVSNAMKSKGKLEMLLCGSFAGEDGRITSGGARTTRLDRDRSEESAAFDHAVRGDLLSICPPPELGRPRIAGAGKGGKGGDGGEAARVDAARIDLTRAAASGTGGAQ